MILSWVVSRNSTEQIAHVSPGLATMFMYISAQQQFARCTIPQAPATAGPGAWPSRGRVGDMRQGKHRRLHSIVILVGVASTALFLGACVARSPSLNASLPDGATG